MRINKQCIADILLYVEEHTDSERECVFLEELVENLPYSKDVLICHIREMNSDSLKLFKSVDYSDDTVESVYSLSHEGNELANLIHEKIEEKDNETYLKQVKSIGAMIGNQVLKTAIEAVVTAYLTKMGM